MSVNNFARTNPSRDAPISVAASGNVLPEGSFAPHRRGANPSLSSGTPSRHAEKDEQVLLWLHEYVRRRDSSNPELARRGSLPMGQLSGRIAQHYEGLVESVARRFSASGEPMDDLVQEGCLGLLSALSRFDPTKSVKFSTYATHFIAGSINHYLRDKGKIIKEPAWLHEICSKINRTGALLTQQLGREPHAGEIASVLNLTEEAVEEILNTRAVFQVGSLNAGGSADENASGGAAVGGGEMLGLVDPEKIRSDKFVTLQLPIEDRIVLDASVQNLKTLEQRVLHEFFYADLNQTEIARNLDISCNYVSHIIKSATKKLRRILGETDVLERQRNAEATSVVDAATGLYVQTHIRNRLDEELTRAARAGRPFALIVVEVEGLPTIAGRRRDDLWRACGEAVRKSLRKMDVAGRYEGNSLLILLPNTGAQAGIVAVRLFDVLVEAGRAMGQSLNPRLGAAYYPTHALHAPDLLRIAHTEACLPVETVPVLAAEGAETNRQITQPMEAVAPKPSSAPSPNAVPPFIESAPRAPSRLAANPAA